ncbi:hypothetical protein LPJ73_001596 [Coemansia sp. RSA 2703]|nr:hypothetical protein LPJ73_001596 [Coemansia sp. RSA 2703]KAJ2374259.1 hypothetical protein IW150_003199 [Coemansia sp. RSA 2607]KAJ2391015.1 hypothetical protein GGI05_003060 [Coemansia sp. RSA 2603]
MQFINIVAILVAVFASGAVAAPVTNPNAGYNIYACGCYDGGYPYYGNNGYGSLYGFNYGTGWGFPFAANYANSFNANQYNANYNDDTVYKHNVDANVASSNVNAANSANIIV